MCGGSLSVKTIQLREFAADRHGTVDDRPYGGGAGMVLKAEPIVKALRSIDEPVEIIIPSSLGQRWKHTTAQKYAQASTSLLFICGRFRGIDQRVIDHYADKVFSIGNYILSNGELASLVMMDSILRLMPEVLGNAQSALEDVPDKQTHGVPCYTRPSVFEGDAVPEVLLSGDREKIERWKMNLNSTRFSL